MIKFLHYSLIFAFGLFSCVNKKNNDVDLSKYLKGTYKRIDTSYYPNKIISQLKYIESDSAYVNVTFYKSGKVKSIGPVLNRQCHGEYIDWLENGSIRWIRYYDKGNQIGISKTYFENGRIKIKRDFQAKIDTEFYENGNPESISLKDSCFIYNYMNGKIFNKETKLRSDSTLIEYYNENSALTFKGYYKNTDTLFKNGAPFEGTILCYFLNKDTALLEKYKKGKVEGRNFRKFGTGKLASISNIKNGQRIGIYERFYNNGQKMYYKNGDTGEEKMWDENGNEIK